MAPAIKVDIVANGCGQKASPHLGRRLGRHLVPPAGDIRLTAGANDSGEVLTWGDKKPIVFRYDQLSQTIFGYVAANLAQFNASGGQGGAGVV